MFLLKPRILVISRTFNKPMSVRDSLKNAILALPGGRLADIAHKWIYSLKKKELLDSFPPCPYKTRGEMYDFIMETEIKSAPVYYLEFGVFQGGSIKYWVERNTAPGSEFYGFDTFTGLPENWTPDRPKGSFDVQGKVPDIKDARVKFVPGLFSDTLPGFLQNEYNEGSLRKIIHLDADLYSSTLYVLSALLTKLKKGDILIFDEWGSHVLHEFKAFHDFFEYSGIKYTYLSSAANYFELAIKIA
jgi:O-methyltransferase